MCHLISDWNEFRKAPYFSLVLSAPTGAIFEGANHEMTNTMTSNSLIYKELVEELVGGQFTEEQSFQPILPSTSSQKKKSVLNFTESNYSSNN